MESSKSKGQFCKKNISISISFFIILWGLACIKYLKVLGQASDDMKIDSVISSKT